MATLREVRKKLSAVHNIQKITQAMEMVAASRLRKAQAKTEMARPYARKLKEVLETILLSADDIEHPFFAERETQKSGFVIITGDRGLCGSYNQAVISNAEKMLNKYDPANVELIVVGRKGIDHFSRKKWHVSKTLSDWGGKITYNQIASLTHHLIKQFLGSHLDEIWLIYTHYISLSTRKVVVEPFFTTIDSSNKTDNRPLNYIFEPNAAEVLADILPRYYTAKMQTALYEAYASELAARIFSMRAATSNAEEMIEKLTLIRNKVRQTNITRELIEITSGVESLK